MVQIFCGLDITTQTLTYAKAIKEASTSVQVVKKE